MSYGLNLLSLLFAVGVYTFKSRWLSAASTRLAQPRAQEGARGVLAGQMEHRWAGVQFSYLSGGEWQKTAGEQRPAVSIGGPRHPFDNAEVHRFCRRFGHSVLTLCQRHVVAAAMTCGAFSIVF